MLHQPVSPSVHLHQHGPSTASELDAFLSALSTSPTSQAAGNPFDTLLFAAASASGPGVTRQHLQHASWMSAGRSLQMPRSERLRLAARQGTGAMTPPAELVLGEGEEMASPVEQMQQENTSTLLPYSEAGVEEVDEVDETAQSPLSGRARTPPTPPLAPVAKRARPTGVQAPQLREALHAAATATPAAGINAHGAAANAVAVAPAAAAEQEVQVQCMARTRIPTAYGPVFLHVYHNNLDGKEHLAIVSDPAQLDTPAAADTDFVPIRSHTLDARWHDGETAQERITRGAYVSRLSGHSALPAPVPLSPAPALADAPLVRIHSECFTGETLGSLRCDCGEQLDAALSLIAHSPGKRGIVLYLRQEGRGIGLLEKVRAYNLQDLGMDTVQANLALGRGEDERTYGVAAAMLRDLGVGSAGIRLLTNNPSKVHAMRKEGIEVPERVPMVPRDWQLRDAASHTHALPLTAPQTPDPAALGESGWDARSKGATIVGGGIVRSEELERYLRTKVERMGHMLDLPAAKRV